MTKKRNEPNIVLCRKCGKPITWFNYNHIYEGGVIVASEHVNCDSANPLRDLREVFEAQAKLTGANH